MLLDEATSALDTKSEEVVQAALDRAAQKRITIIMVHWPSAIKHADNIVLISEGRIIEQGSHDEFLEKKEAYYNLIETQRIATKQESKSQDENPILSENDDDLL